MPHHRILVPLALVLLATTATAQEAEPPTLDPPAFSELDVFQLEYASDPQIAPGGEAVVYRRNSMSVMKDQPRGSLWIVDASGQNHRKLNDGDGGESSPRWSPSGDRIAFVASGGEGEGSEIHIHWRATGHAARLTQLPRSPSNLTWSPDGRHLAFTMLVPEDAPTLVKPPKKPEGAEWAPPPRVITRVEHEADGHGHVETGYTQVFVLPADGGTPRAVTTGPFHHRGTLAWSPDSKTLYVSGNRDPDWEYQLVNSEIYAVPADGSAPPRALTHRNGPDTDPAVSPDGRHIAYLGYDDTVQTYRTTNLYVMDAEGGNKRQLAKDLDRDLASPTWHSSGKALLLSYDDHGTTKIARISLADGTVEDLAGGIGGTSIGRPYASGSFSVASDGTLAYVATTPARPAELTLLRPGKKSQALTDLNGDLLAHRTLGEVEEIWFQSSHDDRPIQGWIVHPPGFDPAKRLDPEKRYPLLLEIHGGPIAHYGPHFAAEMQLYAAAGYVVLYTNPRGSTSYGEEFGNLLHHDYPGNDYDDVLSGVDAVIARGYVDPERLYVTGGSAGGILTAWIVGKTQRFRAAAVVKPVINWYSKVLVADNYAYYHDYRFPGSPWENPEVYLRYSPISLVGNVETPTLVMVGTADLRTPLSESKQLYHALKLRRIDTALVEIPEASHAIARRPSQLITKVAHVLAWFEKYGGPGENP
jgi:dipeptidyl aminopeptidase/acylaminoacyl peptidase